MLPDPAVVRKRLLIGLDLGQTVDYSALAVVDQTEHRPPAGKVRREYLCDHLERWPLGTPYPDIVADVRELLGRLGQATLLVDGTGVGRPVVDLFKQAQIPSCRLVPVSIHGGNEWSWKSDGWLSVPKRDLAGAVQSALGQRRLRLSRELREAKTLADELRTFSVKVSLTTGAESYEAWRDRQKDDTVLAVAIAVWFGDHCCRRLVVG